MKKRLCWCDETLFNTFAFGRFKGADARLLSKRFHCARHLEYWHFSDFKNNLISVLDF
jgi:hypothetical protein